MTFQLCNVSINFSICLSIIYNDDLLLLINIELFQWFRFELQLKQLLFDLFFVIS